MNKGACAIAAAALLVGGCSGKAATPPRGVLPPGTAVLSIDGKDLGTSYAVRCQRIDWMTRIHTDLHSSKVHAMLSTADKLKAEFVRFDAVDGFTGSYEHALQGEASVTMTGPTYHITGAALGFNNAERTKLKAETFTINVSC
ncbi:lipoprotein LpqH [Candidatus Mycobacterium wuenschmannii]|uniref:Lipoprotein LpqH n=1 Tax=Candidatus Mycobacterium wuenschmannii TaxID=3027808 RepID=A0ABY8VS79_9MYCO|nr:lipoprotein LpqH [Candidatus Mycobacterium wuenschmannii]WIM86493.1 lipoprotein LpqH [Candidatus Mycobacterium wuenschmannii]